MSDGYFDTRYAHDPRRSAVWQHLARYLARWVPADADVHATLAAAKADPKIAQHLADKQIVKEIALPGRLVNFVVKE